MLIHSEICFFQLHSFSTHLTSYLSSLPPFWQESFPTVVSLLKLYFDIQGPSGRTLSCSLPHSLGLPSPSYPVSTPPSQQAALQVHPWNIAKLPFPVSSCLCQLHLWKWKSGFSVLPFLRVLCSSTNVSPPSLAHQPEGASSPWSHACILPVALPAGIKALLMSMQMCSVECKSLDWALQGRAVLLRRITGPYNHRMVWIGRHL